MSVKRRTDFNKWPRTDQINEKYYARDNQPSYNQLRRENSHFFDSLGRQYTLAVNNGQPFQNLRLQMTNKRVENQQCLLDSYGHVTLYVKLVPKETQWFGGQSDLHHPLVLYERVTGQEHVVELESAHKYSMNRRTGTVTLRGLSLDLCDSLLNKGQ